MSESKHPLAIVTGAGSGMGQAITWALSAASYRVVAIGRTLEKLNQTVERSPGPGEISAVAMDVADRPAVFATLDEIVQQWGVPALLVNNAGINIRQRAVDVLSAEDFDRVISTNLTGAFNVTQAVLGSMIEVRSGLIITISSIAGLRPLPLAGAAYSASKFGLNGYMGTLGREVAPFGIRTTLICPGEVATPILDQRPVPITQEQREAMVQPEDIASAVLFVANLPPRAHVPELVIKPLVQDYG